MKSPINSLSKIAPPKSKIQKKRNLELKGKETEDSQAQVRFKLLSIKINAKETEFQLKFPEIGAKCILLSFKKIISV